MRSFNPYQQQQYQPVPQEFNAVMKSQVMPILSKGAGYVEMPSFKAPLLNTTGRFYKLDNGQGIIIVPKKGPTTIKTFVKAGSFNEEKNRGISHYIEHNLFNGSQGLAPNEFVEKVTGMGGIYNASTDTSDTDYFIKAPLHKPEDLRKFLTMHSNMLLYPTFTEKTLEKEKGPVISEIQMYQDDPYDKAYNKMVKNLFGIKADYQGLIAGSSKIIKNLTRKDVLDYYNKWYTPDNMVTVIVGDVNPTKTINLASSLFNRKKAVQSEGKKYYEALNLTAKTVRKDITSPQVNSVITEIGLAGPKNNDKKDTMATMALLSALTGHENARLTKALKLMNADVSAELGVLSSDYNAPQLIEINANFATGDEEKGLKTIYSTIEQIARQPITSQEMFIVKNKLKNSLLTMSESSMGIANLIGNSIVGHGDISSYTNIVKDIENLTPQDIQTAARKYLDLNRASIVMIHPEKQGLSFKGNSDKFKLKNIKEYDLPNNLRVVINDDPALIKASANLKIRTDDIKTLKPGVANILSVMLGKGTKNYSEEQLNQIIDSYNLGIKARTDGNSLNIGSNCPKEMLPMSLRVMKDMIYNTDFTQEKFDKAKEEIRLKYTSLPKNPANKALEALYPDYLLGQTSRKVLKNLDKVTLDDVKTLHQQLLADSQGVIAIDGAVNSTPGLGNNVFMELQSGIRFNKPQHSVAIPESKPLEQNIIIAEPEKRSQASIIQIFKIKESGNIKDHAALLLLNEVLGGNSQSRLFMDLRETQKLAYRVNSSYMSDGKYGNLALLIKTTTEDDLKGASYDNLKKSIDGFKKHINKLTAKPVSVKELEDSKLQVKTDLDCREFSSVRSGRIQKGFDTLYGSQYNNSLYDVIEQLTPQDIQNAAKLYLSQPSVISLIASPETIENTKPYLNSLGNLQIISQ